MSSDRRPSVPHLITLLAGLGIGWAAAGGRPQPLHATGADRWDESILAAGPSFIKYNETSKIQVAQDAIYFLDYRLGKLMATVPSMQQIGGKAKYVQAFAERDLAADFKLDLNSGPKPHFLMTTGSMASVAGNSYSDGGAPLFVFETSTRQIGVYKIQQQMIGASSQVRCDLLEMKPFATPASAAR